MFLIKEAKAKVLKDEADEEREKYENSELQPWFPIGKVFDSISDTAFWDKYFTDSVALHQKREKFEKSASDFMRDIIQEDANVQWKVIY